jgi:CheY-like chemotaxis protein
MILFIEDEPFFNESYIRKLTQANYKVLLERDITKAIAIFRKRMSEIQIVIIDIMMSIPDVPPEDFRIENAENGFKTGIEILRLLNEIPNGKKIPKILLTNIPVDQFIHTINIPLDVYGCYTKRETPIDDLVNIVNEILMNR